MAPPPSWKRSEARGQALPDPARPAEITLTDPSLDRLAALLAGRGEAWQPLEPLWRALIAREPAADLTLETLAVRLAADARFELESDRAAGAPALQVRLRSAALDPQQAAEGLAAALAQIRQTLLRARVSRPDDDPLTERLLEAVEQQAERLGQEIEQALRDLDRPPAEGDPP